MKKQKRTKTEYNSSLTTSIKFPTPMQIELSQLLQTMFSVKVQSNTLEIVQLNQSLNCLRSQIRLENHPNNL